MTLPHTRFTVQRMMAAVAAVAILLSAWVYRRENGNVEKSLTSLALRTVAHGDRIQRRLAVENLSNAGVDEIDRVLLALGAGLADVDWQVRRAAARSLGLAGQRWARATNGTVDGKIGLATRWLTRAIEDPQAEVRCEALRSLAILHDAVLAPPGSPKRRAAWTSIVAVDGREVAQVRRAMSDADPQVRAAAVAFFARIAPLSEESPDPLVAIMRNDPVSEVRCAAVQGLARGWPEPDSLYRLLLRRAKETPGLAERSTIGWALGSLPPPPAESIPALIDALSLENWALNRTVPRALGKLGPAARQALPALAKAAARELEDPSRSALEAARAISVIDTDSEEAQALLEPLASLLRESRVNFVRQQTAAVLENYGPSGTGAVQSLRDALASDTVDVRERAAFLLGSIGPGARSALADLTELASHDPNPQVRRRAAGAIARIKAE